MTRTSIFVLFTLLGTFGATALAGGHHRHGYYYQAYPAAVPYMVIGQAQVTPSEAPFSQAQIDALASAIVTKQLAAQAQAQAEAQSQAQAMAAPEVQRAIADEIRKRAGGLIKELVKEGGGGLGGEDSDDLGLDLEKLRKRLTGSSDELKELKEASDLHTKSLVEIHKQLEALNKAVYGKTPPAVTKALGSDGFKATLQGMLKPEVKVDDALKALKEKLENTLE